MIYLLSPDVGAVNSIEVQSQDFADSSTGMRFEILGIDYQPGGEEGYDPSSGIDPLSNGTSCLRDAALMQILGVSAATDLPFHNSC